tara:strand:+ start:497 stop:1165 length:669 start_codon:yes stop_codon:yes gene_type:complete
LIERLSTESLLADADGLRRGAVQEVVDGEAGDVLEFDGRSGEPSLDEEAVDAGGEKLGEFVDCAIGAEFAAAEAQGQRSSDLVVDGVGCRDEIGGIGGRGGEDLAEGGTGEGLKFAHDGHVGVDEGDELVADRGVVIDWPTCSGDTRGPGSDHLAEEVLLGIEVVVDSALGETSGERDVVYAGSVQTVGGERVGRGVKESPPVGGLRRFTNAGHPDIMGIDP